MKTKLCVRNIGPSVDSFTLEDMFTTVGNVRSATVQINSVAGADRRFGYVEMETEQEAMDCISRFNGQLYDDLILIVTEDRPHVPDPNFSKTRRRKPAEPKKKPRGMQKKTSL